MKISVFGTGTVGRILAAKLVELKHEVMIGTRDPGKTLARTESDPMGNQPFSTWLDQNPEVKLGTLAEAAAYGALIVNATNGGGSMDALKTAGEKNLSGKILIDIANPLDFSKGMPPTLSICNNDSLGEQIQRAYPGLKVVKTLNTMGAHLMVNPRQLANGEHSVFVSGNDAEAKVTVSELLRNFGWVDIIDLGDITTARGTEMYMPIWIRLWGALQTPQFQLKVVR